MGGPMSDLERVDHSLEKQLFMKEFEGLRPDLFFPDTWNEAQREQAVDMIRPSRIKTGMLAAIPISCQGAKCPYAPTCPLFEKGIAPEGSACPIEMAMLQQFFQDYIEELKVDPTSMVEVSMVRDLVDQEIQYLRKTKLLAQEHFIQENVIGVDDKGKPILKKELHQAVDFEDRIHKRKDKLRSALLATREAKAKVGQGNLDPAQRIADIMDSITSIEIAKEREMRLRLGVPEIDSYIAASEREIEEAETIEDE